MNGVVVGVLTEGRLCRERAPWESYLRGSRRSNNSRIDSDVALPTRTSGQEWNRTNGPIARCVPYQEMNSDASTEVVCRVLTHGN